jgi:hypothetical protein
MITFSISIFILFLVACLITPITFGCSYTYTHTHTIIKSTPRTLHQIWGVKQAPHSRVKARGEDVEVGGGMMKEEGNIWGLRGGEVEEGEDLDQGIEEGVREVEEEVEVVGGEDVEEVVGGEDVEGVVGGEDVEEEEGEEDVEEEVVVEDSEEVVVEDSEEVLVEDSDTSNVSCAADVSVEGATTDPSFPSATTPVPSSSSTTSTTSSSSLTRPTPSPSINPPTTSLESLQALVASTLSQPTKPPILHFGRLYKSLSSDPSIDPGTLAGALDMHLDKLRDYYGSQFESRISDVSDGNARRMEYDNVGRNLRAALEASGCEVRRIEEGMEGWRRDVENFMDEGAEEEREEEEMEEEEEEEEPKGGVINRIRLRTKRYVKKQMNGRVWVKRVVNQAIVVALNYAQMKLEWRGRIREELKKERERPGFPAF